MDGGRGESHDSYWSSCEGLRGKDGGRRMVDASVDRRPSDIECVLRLRYNIDSTTTLLRDNGAQAGDQWQ